MQVLSSGRGKESFASYEIDTEFWKERIRDYLETGRVAVGKGVSFDQDRRGEPIFSGGEWRIYLNGVSAAAYSELRSEVSQYLPGCYLGENNNERISDSRRPSIFSKMYIAIPKNAQTIVERDAQLFQTMGVLTKSKETYKAAFALVLFVLLCFALFWHTKESRTVFTQ